MASFLFIFGLFKQTIQLLQQINVKKCPSSIRRWDSNPRPLERESTPITTRPGLPPRELQFYSSFKFKLKYYRMSHPTTMQMLVEQKSITTSQ